MSTAIALAPVSWQRMAEGIEKVKIRLERAANALTGLGVRYAVVGGNAVAAWVSRVDAAAVRNTRVVDILLRREDMDRAKAALESAGFVHRRVASLGKAAAMDFFWTAPMPRFVMPSTSSGPVKSRCRMRSKRHRSSD